MGYNRFYLSLFLYVILIVLLAAGFAYFLFETGQVTTAIFFLLLIKFPKTLKSSSTNGKN